jgi:hypothetical protein
LWLALLKRALAALLVSQARSPMRFPVQQEREERMKARTSYGKTTIDTTSA